MTFRRLSLKSIIVGLLVTLSMAIVIIDWDIFSSLALENYRKALSELVEREVDRVQDDADISSRAHANNLSRSAAIRTALSRKDYPKLSQTLDQYLSVPSDRSRSKGELTQLYVFDADMTLVAQASTGSQASSISNVLCSQFIQMDAVQSAVRAGQSKSAMCLDDGRLFHVLLTPMTQDVAQPPAYIQVVSLALPNFLAIEERLGMGMNVIYADGYSAYRSPNWQPNTEGRLVRAEYWIEDETLTPLIQINVQRDLKQFTTELADTRNRLMLFSGFITLISIALAILVLHKTTLKPLSMLTQQLQGVAADRRNLKINLNVEGNPELQRLVDVFNEMGAELGSVYERYEEAAFKDPLTSLPNRALFLDRLGHLILLSQRRAEKFGVLLLDLDNFKEINDTFGHHMGDDLLCIIGSRLGRTLRASSTLARVSGGPTGDEYKGDATVARLGGDEFAVLLPNVLDVEGLVSVATRIIDALEPPVELGENTIVIAGTMGIAMYPEHGGDGKDLLRHAEIALYSAKEFQNDFAVYDHTFDHHDADQVNLKAMLKDAIENDQMTLYYQPKLNYKTGCITSVEALVRWQHPERGLIPPNQFIPLSEQRGLIGPLTEWVLGEATRQARAWLEAGLELQVAVNLSSRVLYDLSLPNKVERCLINNQLSPSSLCLEVTEEATMVDPKRALQILARLDEMGISLSIDDFGTGYSSLSYLKRLPVDEIKIDKTFVMEMDTSDNDAKIVHATIDLAHNLGLKVVAEGVESKAALDMLESLNCDFAQGFYLSRPVPADDLVEWLQTSGWACKV